MITTITLRYEWDMGHRLPLHDGKCRRLHGHRYVSEVDVTGPLVTHGPSTGMVADFTDVKHFVKLVIDGQWDHRTMLWEQDELYAASMDPDYGIFRVPFMPTAENIAAELLRLLRPNMPVTRVKVWETPSGSAEVRL